MTTTRKKARPARSRPNHAAVRDYYAELRARGEDSRAVYVPPPPKPKSPDRHRKPPPLVPGVRCRYRRSAEVLTLVQVRDGVAVVRNAEGREYPEALAVLVGVREDE